MDDLVSPLDSPPILSSASSSVAAIVAVAEDELDDDDDACSICLEPFNSEDPPTVTNCKHEYHLHCILEWLQRSKECPICWQFLVLKDPLSQELLAALENERNLTPSRDSSHIPEDNEINLDNYYANDLDFDEHTMQHFVAAARRAHFGNRGQMQRPSGIGPSHILHYVPTRDLPDVQHKHATSAEECQSSSYEFSKNDSPNSSMLTNTQSPSSIVPGDMNMERNSFDIKSSQLLLEGPERSSSSEFLAFSESMKSRFSAVSARYKESISKSTRGFKEKLLARNISVKELGRGVQREMNAGIAGVSRMIERLDLKAKRTGVSVPLSSSTGGTSNFSCKGKSMQGSAIMTSPNVNAGETANDTSSAASRCVHSTIPGQLVEPLAQSGN